MPLNKIPQRQLGKGRGRPMVSSIGFGTMGKSDRSSCSVCTEVLCFFSAIGALYGKTDMTKAYQALTYAADRGMSFWDCADIYGDGKPSSAAFSFSVVVRLTGFL